MKRVIIAGGRDFDDYDYFVKHVSNLLMWDIGEPLIMQGGAKGADAMAKRFATDLGFSSQIEFPADWDTHGKAAGPIRNEQMAQNADMLIAFWDGKSRGTKNMINNALKHGLEIHVYKY